MGVNIESEVRDFTDLTNLLWLEREVMSQVLFKLAEEQLIVSAGQTRWLAAANRELEAALEQLRGTEVLRALESDALAEHLGLRTGATLLELADVSPEPWSTILLEHRGALQRLAEEVGVAAEHNRRLIEGASKMVKATLSSIGTNVGTYDASGTSSQQGPRPSRVDEQA